MPETLEEHEILHLKKRMELDGEIYDREVAYMSDHQVFHRMAVNGSWTPWQYWKLWRKMEDVYQVARTKAAKGWEVEFHRAYSPAAREFTVEVPF